MISPKLFLFAAFSVSLLVSCTQLVHSDEPAPASKPKHLTPYAIVEQSPATDWRPLNLENTLYLELKSGMVVIELAPHFAPNHASNTKQLVRENIFDNTEFYRVEDGFVAQGGIGDNEKQLKPKKGKLNIPGEIVMVTEKPMQWTSVDKNDGYADETGFVDNFAAGRTSDKKQNWLLHCYGYIGMGRYNDIDSGGSDFYIVTGQAPRYLDRNITVFGRVISGMPLLQKLDRSEGLEGSMDVSDNNKIISIRVASDLPEKSRLPLEVMKTDSESFKAYIKASKNRLHEWFIHQHDYIDACSIQIPTRLVKK